MSSASVVVKSKPEHVFRGLLDPEMLSEWWGCSTVIDARTGGTWAGGWGRGEGGVGHQTVLWAELTKVEPNRNVTLKIGTTVIGFQLEDDMQGCRVVVSQEGFPASSPEEEQAALQSWVDAATNLKAYVEKKHPYTPPARAAAPTPSVEQGVGPGGLGSKPQPSPSAQQSRQAATTQPAKPSAQPSRPASADSLGGLGGGAKPSKPATGGGLDGLGEAAKPSRPSSGGGLGGGMGGGLPGMGGGAGSVKAADPYGGLEAMEKGEYKVIDDAGFGVTDPHAVIKSWSKEQGFGYVTHPQLGDIVFDYDGCDFEPAVGDDVVLLVLGKRFDGKPKVKRIACPAKGSKLKQ